jgi:YHS domain-containing protein
MTDIDTLITRVDREIAAEVKRQQADRAKVTQANRERALRLERYEAVAGHLVGLLKPRLDAFIDRFKAMVKAEPTVREHTYGVTLSFAATVAKATLRFVAFPDQDVKHLRLECTPEFVPVVIRCDAQPALDVPFDEVRDSAVVQWFDDRIVSFVKAYLALVRQDAELRDRLADPFVEDPVAGIRFPKYLAASSLERDGQTYYFVDEETRREFEQLPAAAHAAAHAETHAEAQA